MGQFYMFPIQPLTHNMSNQVRGLLASINSIDYGFGSRFLDPAILPAGNGSGVCFSPDGNYLAVTSASPPYISVYPFSVSSGFGSKFPDPNTPLPEAAYSIAFNPSSNVIVVGTSNNSGNNVLHAYAWSASGFGTRFSNPTTLPAGTVLSVAFSPSGSHLAVAHAAFPRVSIYPFDVITGFGSRIANPSISPAGSGNGIAFNAAGNLVAVAHANSPRLTVYPFTGSYGTKLTNPSVLPSSNGLAVAFNPISDALAVGTDDASLTPLGAVYRITSGAFGAKFTDSANLASSKTSVAFSPSGKSIIFSSNTPPYVFAAKWSASIGFGGMYSAPKITIPSSATGISFHPSGLAVAISLSSGGVVVYNYNEDPGFDGS